MELQAIDDDGVCHFCWAMEDMVGEFYDLESGEYYTMCANCVQQLGNRLLAMAAKTQVKDE